MICLIKKYPRISPITISVFMLFVGACRLKTDIKEPLDRLQEVDPKGLALIEADELVNRPKVHPILLDENNFRINGLRVGEQTFLKAETPILAYEMPPQADYVEILRCPENVVIHGGADTLEYVELGAKDLEAETRVYQRNNFWEAATAASGCILIATSYTDTSFEDVSAPSGAFNYYMRACVDHDRLLSIDGFGGINCSRQVSRSVVHKHVNKRQTAELEALAEAANIRSKIDAINRQLVYKTIQLNQQLFECQEKHQTRLVSEGKKSAIAAILGGVIGLGIPILGAAGFKARQYFKPDYDFSYRSIAAQKKRLLANGISPSELNNRKTSLLTSLRTHKQILAERIEGSSGDALGRLKEEAKVTDELTQIVEKFDSNNTGLKNFKNDQLIGRESRQETTKTTRVAQVLAATTITASAALLISHAYAAASQSVPSYPQDAKACYGASAEQQLQNTFCSCARAIASQEDLNTLAEDLEQTTRLQQEYLNQAEMARTPEAYSYGDFDRASFSLRTWASLISLIQMTLALGVDHV